MSRIVTHSESWSGYPTSYLSDHQYYQASNQNNALASTTSTNYANINLTRGSSAETYWYVVFNTNAIPQNATITSCSAKYRCAISSTNSNYVKTRQLRFYSGTNPKGNTATLTTSSPVTSINIGEWTREELNDARVRYYAQRSSGNTNSSIYIRPYGTDLTVNYSWDETLYAISTSSSVQGVGISAQDSETTSGGTNVITVTGVSDLSSIKLMDNNVDVTSSLVRSGSNYTYTLNNVSADHSLTIESGVVSYQVNASSTYAGATIVANPTSVQEGSNCVLTLTTQYFTKVKVEDNGNDITSLFTAGGNNTYTYTLTNVTTAHTIIVSEVTKTLYMNVDNVMKAVNSIKKKLNGEWTTISMVDFWRKVNGTYANDTTVSGKTSLVYGGVL